LGYNPFAVIRDFWGEELSSSLIERMVQAPQEHSDAFSDEYLSREPGLGALPSLTPGHTRPILTTSASDEFRRIHNVYLEAPLLLLYAHEVVVPFPQMGVVSQDPRLREASLEWMLAVKPLFEMGIVHIRADDSAKRHPAFAHRAHGVEKVARELGQDPTSSIAQFRDRWRQLQGEASGIADESSDELDPILWWLALDASVHADHEERYGRRAHRLFKSQAELDLWVALGGSRETLQERTQAKLVALELPKFQHAIPDLVAIRRSSETFAEWRSALATAVARAAPGDEIETSRPAELRRDLAEQLAPFAERVNAETKRSSALAALRVGAKEFGLGAVASAVGFAAGGSLHTAIATGGTANAIKAAAEFKNRRVGASSEAALGRLAMLFFDE
jgi:hypothetical protein